MIVQFEANISKYLTKNIHGQFATCSILNFGILKSNNQLGVGLKEMDLNIAASYNLAQMIYNFINNFVII